MKCTIVTIGNEILIGQTIDTNAAWLGMKLNELGFEIDHSITIQDDPYQILQTLDALENTVDLVIITGGLGPTKDDLTKHTLVKYFKDRLVVNPEILKKIEDFFINRGMEVIDVNRKQAELPEKAIILPNTGGTASGMWFEQNGTVFISLPGVPYEMKGIMEEFGFNQLVKHFELPVQYKRTILTWGVGESFLAESIAEWEDEVRQSGLSLAYLPSPGIVKLRVSGQGQSKALKAQVDQAVDALYAAIPHLIFGEGTQSLAEVVGAELRRLNKTVATAESCTGGYLAHLITAVAGSSDYFAGSVISYANNVKTEWLDVPSAVIDQKGAVSEEVVTAMAKSVRLKLKTDYGLATSGIAGPGGGTPDKPVGTVWIAISGPERTITRLFRLGKSRRNNIHITSLWTLGVLLKELKQQLV